METILNPFLFFKEYKDYVIIYIPYKHNFLKFSLDEWNKIKEGKVKKNILSKKQVLVSKDYKEKFINHYSKFIKNNTPKLGLMYMILTESCNFKCPYCFIEENFPNKKRETMSWEIAEKAIEYFIHNAKIKDKKIIFYGGEPTLNKEVLTKSIKKIRSFSNKIVIGINTNGSFYNEELSKIFKENNVMVSISLDGFPKINDKTRLDTLFKGTSEKVIKNINSYIKDDVFVSFSITINGYNIDYLPAISKFIIKNFPKVKSVGFNLSLQNLKGNKFFADPEFSSLQLYNSFRILRKWGVYEDRILRRLKHIVEENIYLQDCAGCGNQIVVLPNGMVGPCHGYTGIKKYFEENINNLKFEKSNIFKKWSKLSPVTKPFCIDSNCPFILICGNSCPYYSEITKGDLNAPDDRMYPFLKIMIQEVGKDLFLEPPKAIFVDYDGTVISRKPSLEVLNMVAEKYGYKKLITKQDFYDVRKILAEVAKDIGKENELNNMIYLYLKKWKENSEINKPLLDQLIKIKEKYSIPIYILSNSKKENISKELETFGFIPLFTDIFGSEIERKPSEQYYLNVFAKLNLNPEEIFYIGDSYTSDIKPIYEFGIRSAASFYANPLYFTELNNEWLIDIFDDLNEHV